MPIVPDLSAAVAACEENRPQDVNAARHPEGTGIKILRARERPGRASSCERDLRPRRCEAARPPWPVIISACDGTIRHHR